MWREGCRKVVSIEKHVTHICSWALMLHYRSFYLLFENETQSRSFHYTWDTPFHYIIVQRRKIGPSFHGETLQPGESSFSVDRRIFMVNVSLLSPPVSGCQVCSCGSGTLERFTEQSEWFPGWKGKIVTVTLIYQRDFIRHFHYVGFNSLLCGFFFPQSFSPCAWESARAVILQAMRSFNKSPIQYHQDQTTAVNIHCNNIYLFIFIYIYM